MLTGVSPSVYRYEGEQGNDDELRKRMRELAGERKRFGSPRLHSCSRGRDWSSTTSGPSVSTGRMGSAYGERGVVRVQQEPG